MSEEEQKEVVVEAEKPKLKKRDAWYYAFVIGQWACLLAIITAGFYMYTQKELLQSNPCDLCQKEEGMMCTPVPKLITNPEGIEDDKWYKDLNLEGLKDEVS